ncbi:MAG: hypothetical protein DRZ76_02480 [Candidatus Nealsonbacteria bacterium]|nr:MAG: hypothetical protein DRZ76_02480 [Candidatus Nealsonbacteria bacterium]
MSVLKVKMEEEEIQWEEEKEAIKSRYSNYGRFNIKIPFEVTGYHDEVKQVIQNFFDEMQQKLKNLTVVYEYLKRIA